MKNILWILGAGLALALPAELHGSGPPVLETDAEYFAWGEFRADGRRSFAVIDRESGGVRLMGSTSTGGLVAGTTFATGVEAVTSVAVGRFGATTNRDDVAVASPEANRVRVVSPFGGQGFDVWPLGIGPELVAEIPVAGGTSGFSGLATTAVWNPTFPLGPHRLGFMARVSGNYQVMSGHAPQKRARQILAVAQQTGGALRYGELYQHRPDAWVFAVADHTQPTLPLLASVENVPPGSRVLWGAFNPLHTRSVFLFHAPGSDLVAISVANTDGSLGALITRMLPEPMAWIQAAEADGAWRIIGCTMDGSMLRIFGYSAMNTLTPIQNMAPPPGESWTGLLPVAGGEWFAASAPPGLPTSRLTRHIYQGGLEPFASKRSYGLAPLHRDELTSDILLFAGRPFHDNGPALKGRLRAGGWTSALDDDPQFGALMHGVAERWRGPSAGVGDPVAVQLGARPSSVTHGLANQIADNASFFSLETPVGAMPDMVVFEPEPGYYNEAIEIAMLTASPSANVYYTIDGTNNWQLYSEPVGPVFRDTVVRAYVTDATGRSPVQSAAYTFPESPLDVDTDGDGVPDFIKELYGIDPLAGGVDSDGDGVSDLFEILLGSDPTDPDDVPGAGNILSLTRHFNFLLLPMSHSGAGPNDVLQMRGSWRHDPPDREGTWIGIHRPDGRLAMEGWTNFGLTGMARFRRLNHVAPDPPLFWVAGTPERFTINDGNPPEMRHGRGIFRIVDYQAEPMHPLPRPELSGTPALMAQQWVTAVRDHLETHAPVSLGGDLSYLETLHLLLVEQALGTIFQQRGLIPVPHVTLTPFRGDTQRVRRPMPGAPFTGRVAVQDAWLATLGERGPSDNGYVWAELLEHMRTGGRAAWREVLDATAREIYRIGYHAYSDPDDLLNIPPFDALRQLFETGALPDAYTDRLMIPQDVVDRAVAGLNGLIKGLPQRDFTSSPLPLVAGEDFDRSPWIVLRHEHNHTKYRLADRQGNPMDTPLGFRILPGFRFTATGHLTDHPGGGYTLWVETIALAGAPMPGWSDSDWNALDDGWEAFLFGRLCNNPFLDLDGDGYTLLQEMLEGTDPHYADDFPSVPVVEFTMPQVHIESLAPYQFRLSWHWNNPYDNRLGFHLQGGSDMVEFTPLLDLVPRLPGGLYEVDVDPPPGGPPLERYFFRAGLRLVPNP